MNRLLLSALVGSSVFLTPAAANAAIDAAGAAALKAMLEKRLEQNILDTKGNTVKLTRTGELTVTPQGTYYAVKYPHFIATSSKGQTFDIGVISSNMMPGSKPTEWKATLAIPSPIRISEKDGTKDIMIEIGAQKSSLIFDDALSVILLSDLSLKDIKVKNGNMLIFSIDEITSNNKYTESAPGILSGPFSSTIKNFRIKSNNGQNPGSLGIGAITIDGEVGQLDANMVKQYNNKINELKSAGFDESKMGAGDLSAFWKIIMEHGLSQFDNAKVNFKVNDVSFTGLPAPEARQGIPVSFKLGEIALNQSISGLRSDKSNWSIGLNMADASFSGVPVEYAPYMPSVISMTINTTNIPHKELMAQMGSLATAGLKSAENMKCAEKDKANCDRAAAQQMQMQMMGMQAMMMVPSLLSKAGTTINTNAGITTPSYTVKQNGSFVASDKAVLGMTGKAKMVFTGLDTTIASLQQLAAKPTTDPRIAQQLKQTAQTLTAAQMFGQQGTDETGKPARIYDFTLDETGAAKLNGTDLSALMSKSAARPQDTGPTPPAPATPAPPASPAK